MLFLKASKLMLQNAIAYARKKHVSAALIENIVFVPGNLRFQPGRLPPPRAPYFIGGGRRDQERKGRKLKQLRILASLVLLLRVVSKYPPRPHPIVP